MRTQDSFWQKKYDQMMEEVGALRLNPSNLQQFMKCPRMFAFNTIARVIPVVETQRDPGNPELGIMVHAGIADFLAGGENPTGKMRDSMDKRYATEDEVLYRLTAKTTLGPYADNMLHNWKVWAATEQFHETYGEWWLETHFEVSLSTNTIFSGYADFIGAHKYSPAVTIIDWKTAGRFGGVLHPMDTQLLSYDWLLSHSDGHGIPRYSTEWAKNVIVKRLKGAKTAKPPFVEERTIEINPHKRAAFDLQMLELVDRIWDTIASGIFPPYPGSHCDWQCPYTFVCHSMEDGSDWEHTLETQYRVRTRAETPSAEENTGDD